MGIDPFASLLQDLVVRETAPGHLSLWRNLAYLSCRLAGGEHFLAEAYSRVIEFYLAAADVLDEVQDEDQGGALWQKAGTGVAVNAGTGLLALSLWRLAALAETIGDTQPVLAASRILTSMAYRASRGQHLDLVEGSSAGMTFHSYHRIMNLKSGSLVAAVCAGGAALAGGSRYMTAVLGSCGLHLGIALQIENDTRSLLIPEQEKSDWRLGKRTLPILYAFYHEADPRCQRFCKLFLFHRTDPDVQAEMVKLLAEVGGFAFAAKVAEMERTMALTRLNRLKTNEWAERLLEVIRPQ